MVKQATQRRIRDVAEWLTAHGFVLGCFVLPLGLGVAYETGTLGDASITEPGDRTAVYMASMSMIPFPDPSVEVIEVTDELVNTPKSRPQSEPSDGTTDAPLPEIDPEGTTPAPRTSDTPTRKNTPREEEVADSLRAGGRVEGPTQDGDGARAQECLPDNPSIRSVGQDTYEVDQDLVDYYVDHLREAEKLALTHWQHGSQGNVMGFRVRRIRCGNDLYQLGFRGGDIVQKVNGEEITSIPQAIKAYRKVRRKQKLVIQIKRNKQDRKLVYQLR